MEYTRIGRSGLSVSQITLGCLAFGDSAAGKYPPWAIGEDGARAIVAAALEAGVTSFDTANVYSEGISELILGKLLREMSKREDVVIATKVHDRMRGGPYGAGLSRKAIMQEIDASLRRLGTEYVDLYQIHRWDESTPIEETMEALHDIVRAGKALYIGASNLTAWQLARAHQAADSGGWTRFISMQTHYNLLHRDDERELIPLCEDQGLGVLAWSPLARGWLAGEWDGASARSTTDEFGRNLYGDGASRILERVKEVSAARGVSRAQVALAWLRAQGAVSSSILGATRPEHVTEAVAGISLELTEAECESIVAS